MIEEGFEPGGFGLGNPVKRTQQEKDFWQYGPIDTLQYIERHGMTDIFKIKPKEKVGITLKKAFNSDKLELL